MFGAFVGEDLVELVGEACQGGRVRRRVRLCGERSGEVGFLAAQRFEALTVATYPFLAKHGRQVTGLERLEVPLELSFDSCDLGARRCELLLDPRPLLRGKGCRLGERPLDQPPVAVQIGELRENGCLEPVLRQPLAAALVGAVLVPGGAGVVRVAAAAAVGGSADVGAAAVVAAHEPGEQELTRIAAPQRRVLPAAAQELMRLVEQLLVDERLV